MLPYPPNENITSDVLFSEDCLFFFSLLFEIGAMLAEGSVDMQKQTWHQNLIVIKHMFCYYSVSFYMLIIGYCRL